MADQFLQGAGAEVPFGDPANHLQIAQATGPSLIFGSRLRRFVILAAALAAFLSLGFEEGGVWPNPVGAGDARICSNSADERSITALPSNWWRW